MEIFDFDKYDTLIFDFDGTLFDTDNANYLAYKEAVYRILGRSIPFEHNRTTRESIKKYFPNVANDEMNKIINRKEYCFREYLNDIYAIVPTVSIIFKAKHLRKKIILLTKASRKRIMQILEYMSKKFPEDLSTCIEDDHMYFKEDIGDDDKYDFVFDREKINNFSRTAIFENDKAMRHKIIKNGFPETQIFPNTSLRFFIIQKNEYLNTYIRGYFRSHYSKMGNPGNPDYICYLKNDNDNIMKRKLEEAKILLTDILVKDFALLHNLYDFNMICMVPRSKKESYYSSEQQLIRKTVSEVAQKLSISDGTMCIVREKNTRTTHKKDDADGSQPYVGITKDTCRISEDVKGKDILLVDDIYTETINIDEDAIQALLDKGAKSVMFYAVGKTINKKANNSEYFD